MRNKRKEPSLRPIQRRALRLTLGKAYYTNRKRWWLLKNRGRFGKQKLATRLPCQVAAHATPLLRQLKDVDMHLQYNKIANLKLAVAKLDGMVLEPGEMFSYWKGIGRPTYKRGFTDGMVLSHGKVEPGVGGGLCQLSNLIYWMTLHTPLTVSERYRHSYDVFPDVNRTQPFGSGATCVYNYRDLVIQNNTALPFQLCLAVTDLELQGSWNAATQLPYQYQVYESRHWIESEYWGGYSRHNILRRKKCDFVGNEVEDEYITENHVLMMYAPFLEHKAADAGMKEGERPD